MQWASSTNGYGPVEINQSNGENQGNDGKVIQLNDKQYNRGLGTHVGQRLILELSF